MSAYALIEALLRNKMDGAAQEVAAMARELEELRPEAEGLKFELDWLVGWIRRESLPVSIPEDDGDSREIKLAQDGNGIVMPRPARLDSLLRGERPAVEKLRRGERP